MATRAKQSSQLDGSGSHFFVYNLYNLQVIPFNSLAIKSVIVVFVSGSIVIVIVVIVIVVIVVVVIDVVVADVIDVVVEVVVEAVGKTITNERLDVVCTEHLGNHTLCELNE
jgi:hypothetical protein